MTTWTLTCPYCKAGNVVIDSEALAGGPAVLWLVGSHICPARAA